MDNVLDPPSEHHAMTVVRVWPTVTDGWRWDVQSPGPPKQRMSGNARSEREALFEASEELSLLSTRSKN